MLLIIGVIGLVFFGIGLLFLLLAVFDYLLQQEKIINVTADQIRSGDVPPEPGRAMQLFILSLLFVTIILCWLAWQMPI